MRSAVLGPAFGELGARIAVSGAFAVNGPSLAASHGLGHPVRGSSTIRRPGDPAEQLDLDVRHEHFRPAIDVGRGRRASAVRPRPAE
jgi:hypothetical protein